jgi:hypothetical protein
MKPSCSNCQHWKYQDITKMTWQVEPPPDYDCDLHLDLRETCSDIGAIVSPGRAITQATTNRDKLLAEQAKKEVIASQCSEYKRVSRLNLTWQAPVS